MATVKSEPMDDPGFGLTAAVAEGGGGAEARPTDNNHNTNPLQRLITPGTSAELLEKGVNIGSQVLKSLKLPLEAVQASASSSQWLKAITQLESLAKPTRTIVGVVGNTGAGKSSVISAVLDEERLLPTNCMRACTASPTEISYNHSNDPAELYRAEVEFITADDWLQDLRGLYTDLIDGSGGVSRDCTNNNSDAGVAYAKIKAVYPRYTKEMIAETAPEQLIRHPSVARILGAVKALRATTAASLYRQLQEYVDSKEKNTDKAMEYWPLIKVVRIYTKASALSTGACLVDLPGVQDSNAARAAVAANYMKSCTGLWIVAPITRAVDDKTAKSLLGDSFRRQLKYDGTYSAVTFICSKTDDISVTEASESLGIEDEVSESWSRIKELSADIKKRKSEMAELRDQRDVCLDLIDNIEQAWDVWETLGNKLADGATVYAPATSPTKKRKRKTRPKGSRKDHHSSDVDSDSSDSEGSVSSDKENQGDRGEPLTSDEVDAKLAGLKGEKKELRDRKKGVDEKVKALREITKNLVAEKDTILAEVKAVCIQGRNQYSKKAIKHDFAMGIKELDQEAAAEEDEANFDPEIDLRDYDAVAASLPVFCVSSRAFQKLSGRLEKDDFNGGGFQSLDDTEIPQLQAHAKKLTEARRTASSRRFLTELLQLLNSIKMWASEDETMPSLSDTDKAKRETELRQQLQQMDQYFDVLLKRCIASMQELFTEHIFANFDRYLPMTVEAAVSTALRWGAPRGEGGLFWATYKATCRRNGVFSGCSGPRDFNAELFLPMSKYLAAGWERAFIRHLPVAVNEFLRAVRDHLAKFHRKASANAKEYGVHDGGLNLLSQQLQAHMQRVNEMGAAGLTLAQEIQRDASRGFIPVVQEEMIPAYEGCVNERGPGSFMRMKQLMLAHVETQREAMFQNAADAVELKLEELCAQVGDFFATSIQEMSQRISRDYLGVIVGVSTLPSGVSTQAERSLRRDLRLKLTQADQAFAVLFPELHDGPNAISKKEEDEKAAVMDDATNTEI